MSSSSFSISTSSSSVSNADVHSFSLLLDSSSSSVTTATLVMNPNNILSDIHSKAIFSVSVPSSGSSTVISDIAMCYLNNTHSKALPTAMLSFVASLPSQLNSSKQQSVLSNSQSEAHSKPMISFSMFVPSSSRSAAVTNVAIQYINDSKTKAISAVRLAFTLSLPLPPLLSSSTTVSTVTDVVNRSISSSQSETKVQGSFSSS